MFFQVLVWLALVVMLGSISLSYFLIMLNGLRKYSIGGVPNSLKKKVLILGFAICGCYLWYLLLKNSPFSITVGLN